MKIVSASQIQEIDSLSINKYKIPSLELMENAGRKTSEIILSKIESDGKILIVVGKGNNGGDGLVVARLLIEQNREVVLAMTSHPQRLSPDSQDNWKRLKALKPKVVLVQTENDIKALKDQIKTSKYIVDALFGTGLNSEVKGRYYKIIEAINMSGKPVFAVDIPSGLSADTGKSLGIAVRARVTVTFGFSKLGLVLHPGYDYAKSIYVVDIGFPEKLTDAYDTGFNLITPDLFSEYFSFRENESHKGSFGHIVVFAGSVGKMGAGWLTSKAALRSGSGLVTYGIPETAFSKFDPKFAEVMIEPIYDKKRGHFVEDSIDSVKMLCQHKNAVALGPGIGTYKETSVFVSTLISRLQLPLVIDADGLNVLVDNLQILKKRKMDTVLTPHPGEMSKLTKLDIKTISNDRVGVAKDFAKRHQVYLVLKGNRTVVATPEGEIYINPTGNPGMATAGMGDALTGMITSFIGRGIPVKDAVIAAVYIHGLAGDAARNEVGEIGMITSDMIDNIPKAIKVIQNIENTGE